MTAREELWDAIRNLHRLLDKQRARIEKLEALQWTEEEIDKLACELLPAFQATRQTIR